MRRKRELLEVLKQELEFLASGGYRKSPLTPWKAALIFEDSPTCLLLGEAERPQRCAACPLMRYVPAESRGEEVPCRHIPLDDQGETVDSLYRTATQEETEQVLGRWLRRKIAELEEEARLAASFRHGLELSVGPEPRGRG